MVYRIIKIMAFLLLISTIISLINVYDFNQRFTSKNAVSYMEDYKYHFIAVVPEDKGASIQLLKEGINKAGKEFKIITEIYTAKTKTEQIEILKMAELSEVDGIILWPIANNGFTEPINALSEKNIPVVLISVDSPNSYRESFIGLGQSSIQMAVTELVNAINGTGEICMLSYNADQTDADIRMEELSEIANKYNTIKIKRYYLEDDNFIYEVEQIKKILKNNPEIDAFFCINSNITLVVTSALQSINREDIIVMGYDNFDRSEEYIRNGSLYGIIFENAEFMGYVSVRYLRDINRDKWVPETLDPGIKLMTLESIDTILP